MSDGVLRLVQPRQSQDVLVWSDDMLVKVRIVSYCPETRCKNTYYTRGISRVFDEIDGERTRRVICIRFLSTLKCDVAVGG